MKASKVQKFLFQTNKDNHAGHKGDTTQIFFCLRVRCACVLRKEIVNSTKDIIGHNIISFLNDFENNPPIPK